MKRKTTCFLISLVNLIAIVAQAQETKIEVQAGQPVHRLSRHLTGACIEDVNREVYGGIDSQMSFGASFARSTGNGAIRLKEEIYNMIFQRIHSW